MTEWTVVQAAASYGADLACGAASLTRTATFRSPLTKLREEAYIDYKEGYVDSGASPNQTKPVETATAKAADSKKLKKKKKLGIL